MLILVVPTHSESLFIMNNLHPKSVNVPEVCDVYIIFSGVCQVYSGLLGVCQVYVMYVLINTDTCSLVHVFIVLGHWMCKRCFHSTNEACVL